MHACLSLRAACLSLAGSDRLIWVILMPVSDFAAGILVCLQGSAANPTICPERVLANAESIATFVGLLGPP